MSHIGMSHVTHRGCRPETSRKEISRGTLWRSSALQGREEGEVGDVASNSIASRPGDEGGRAQTGTTVQMCRDAFRHEAVSEATEGIVEVLPVAASTLPPPHAARAAPSTLSPSPLANVIGPSLPAGPSLPGVGGGELYEQIGLDLLHCRGNVNMESSC